MLRTCLLASRFFYPSYFFLQELDLKLSTLLSFMHKFRFVFLKGLFYYRLDFRLSTLFSFMHKFRFDFLIERFSCWLDFRSQNCSVLCINSCTRSKLSPRRPFMFWPMITLLRCSCCVPTITSCNLYHLNVSLFWNRTYIIFMIYMPIYFQKYLLFYCKNVQEQQRTPSMI